jgi:hypothetical protein
MHKAATELENWSHAVAAAQARAAEAIAEWNRADAEEQRRKAWWNSLTAAQQRQAGQLTDTWSPIRAAAQEILAAARADRDAAASRVAAGIAQATNEAPATPPFLNRMGDDFHDLIDIGEYR